MLTQRDIEDLMKRCRKPRRPRDDACCWKDCRVCVFDNYDAAVARYEKQMNEYESVLLKFEE